MRKRESDRRKRKRTECLEEVRGKDRERQRKYRAQKKAGKNSNSPAYKCKGTLTKDLKKVASVLPNSPRKRSKVVKELVYLACDDSPFGSNREGRPSLDTSVIERVKEFYERDDNSRMSPGKRDTVTVKTNGTKEVLQKRHLYVTLDELYQLWRNTRIFPSVVLSLLLFDLAMSC